MSARSSSALAAAAALDEADPLRSLRELFQLPEGTIYLDGNSLGPMPKATPARMADVVQREWGQDLITSWNKAGWFASPQRVGDLISPLIGAKAGEVVATDSISVNLYKLLYAAISIAENTQDNRTEGGNHLDRDPASDRSPFALSLSKGMPRASTSSARTDRPAHLGHGSNQENCSKTVLSERENFPTDLYIAQSLCRARGWELELVETAELPAAMAKRPAIVMLTHVNYRTGAMHDMGALTAQAQAAGSLVIWDLAHSAGAVEVDLHGANADFAVGCGYKYLNGGPGSPAFLWVHPRHVSAFDQPLSGWWGHAAPFAFTPDYTAAPGIARYLCGTQPILSMAALEVGLECFAAAEKFGGMAALRQKSLALTRYFAEAVMAQCANHGLRIVSPQSDAERGSQVCITRDTGDTAADSAFGYAIVQALIARGVIGDFRAGHPPIMRFGFAPLYIGFQDAQRAADHLAEVLQSGEWQQAKFNARSEVT